MKMASKATINRFKSIDSDISRLLAEQCQIAENRAACEADGYSVGLSDTITDSQYDSNYMYILGRGYDCKLLAGLYTKYPALVKTSVLLGTIAECRIKDVNKLSRVMFDDKASR